MYDSVVPCTRTIKKLLRSSLHVLTNEITLMILSSQRLILPQPISNIQHRAFLIIGNNTNHGQNQRWFYNKIQQLDQYLMINLNSFFKINPEIPHFPKLFMLYIPNMCLKIAQNIL